MCIGALAGWYVVLRMKGETLSFGDAARGFGFATPSAGQNGSTFDNISNSAVGSTGIGGAQSTGVSGAGGGTVAYGGAGGNGGAFGSGNGGTFSAGNNSSNNASNNADTNISGNSALIDGTGALRDVSGNATTSTSSTRATTTQTTFRTPRLWHVTKTPVAGFEFISGTPALYLAERATGYLFRADIASGEVRRRTNTLIPKIYEAFIGRDGAPIYRSLHETTGAIKTLTGALGTSTAPGLSSLTGADLRNNIFAFDANPESRTIFYLVREGVDFSAYTQPWTAGRLGRETKAFSSAIENWKLFALADGKLVISLKPHDGVPGYAYEVLPDGKLEPLIRAAPGLTVLPLARSRTLVFGTSVGGTLTLFAQTSTTTLQLPVETVADKCVWAPYSPAAAGRAGTNLIVYCAVPSEVTSKNFLRDWYMGSLHTSDSIWRINLTSGRTDQILAETTDGANLDIVDPIIDPTGAYLAFKNGPDGSLWVLRIER